MKNVKLLRVSADWAERHILLACILNAGLAHFLWERVLDMPSPAWIFAIPPLLLALGGRVVQHLARQAGDVAAFGRTMTLASAAFTLVGAGAGFVGAGVLGAFLTAFVEYAGILSNGAFLLGLLLGLPFLGVGAILAARAARAIWRTSFADRWL